MIAYYLQTESKRTPIRLITRLQKSGAIDALNTYYKTHAATFSSLAKGIRIDGGRYEGESQKNVPNGYGKYYGDDGSFYDGHWKDGKTRRIWHLCCTTRVSTSGRMEGGCV